MKKQWKFLFYANAGLVPVNLTLAILALIDARYGWSLFSFGIGCMNTSLAMQAYDYGYKSD